MSASMIFGGAMIFASFITFFLALGEEDEPEPQNLLKAKKRTPTNTNYLSVKSARNLSQIQRNALSATKPGEPAHKQDPNKDSNKESKANFISTRLFKKEATTATLIYSAKVLRRRNQGAFGSWLGKITRAWEGTNHTLGLNVPIQMAVVALLLMLVVVAYAIFILLEIPLVYAFVASTFATPMSVATFISVRRKQYTDKFRSALVEFLDGMTRSLASGFTVADSIKMLQAEVPEPLRSELGKVLNAMQLGVSMEEAFEQAAQRVQVVEFWFLSIAVEIQAKSGGSLSKVIGGLGIATKERIEAGLLLKQETSNARSSAWVLGLVPLGLGFFLNMISPGYFDPMLSSELGTKLMYTSIGLYFCAIISFFWILKDRF